MKKNIILVGFMATGKTRVSKILSKMLDMKVLSTDGLIEKREGRKISDIFKESGEGYFRNIEKYIVKECAKKQNIIIDCGGGVVIDTDNIKNLKMTGKMFFLSASPDLILKRIRMEGNRPLLDVKNPMDKIKELLLKRKYFYEKADYKIKVDGKSLENIACEIVSLR